MTTDATRCPACDADSTVTKRRVNQYGVLTRRRKCKVCGRRWTTEELTRPEPTPEPQ